MKKLKHIAAIMAIFISMLVCVDDSFASFINIHSVEVPMQSDCSGASHHQHFSVTDHFFQAKYIYLSVFDRPDDLQCLTKVQPKANFFLSSIWQPPKKA